MMASSMAITYENYSYSNDPETCDEPFQNQQCTREDGYVDDVYEEMPNVHDRNVGDHSNSLTDTQEPGKC